MTDTRSTDAEIAQASDAEVLALIEQVTSALKGTEDAASVLSRLTGYGRHVVINLIVNGIEAYEGKAEPWMLYANFMAVGAILATEYQRRQRVVSIERAKRALPDYVVGSTNQCADGGICSYCGAVWYGLPGHTCPSCGKATSAPTDASKGGQ